TIAERPFVESGQSLLDLVKRFRLHLDERELDVILNVGLGRLSSIEHALRFTQRSFGAHVAHLHLDLVQNLSTALLEDLPKLLVSFAPHLYLGWLLHRRTLRLHDPDSLLRLVITRHDCYSLSNKNANFNACITSIPIRGFCEHRPLAGCFY